MNDYQQKKMKKYTLPQAVYRQALWAVKDLDRMKEKLNGIYKRANDCPSPEISDVRKSIGTFCMTDKTAHLAIEAANISNRINAIEDAFESVPDEYRSGIKDYIVYGVPYADSPSHNTWRKWQQIYIYHVAVNLCIL